MKVGFDIDFTITTGEMYEKVVQKYFPKFDIRKHYTKHPLEYSLMSHGFMTDTYPFDRHFMYDKHKEQIFGEETMLPGFLKVYNLLIEHGIEVYFITERKANTFDITKKWLEKHGIQNPNLFCIGNYNKQFLINELGITLFYEDSIKNAYNILENCNCEVRVIEQLYNKIALNGFRSFRIWTTEYRRLYQLLNYRHLEEIKLWKNS